MASSKGTGRERAHVCTHTLAARAECEPPPGNAHPHGHGKGDKAWRLQTRHAASRPEKHSAARRQTAGVCNLPCQLATSRKNKQKLTGSHSPCPEASDLR